MTEYYTVPQVALLIKRHQMTVYQLLAKGTISGVKGRCWQIPKDQPYLRDKELGISEPPQEEDRTDPYAIEDIHGYQNLAYAIIKQALDDVRANEAKLDALLFLYKRGANFAETMGIDRAAYDEQLEDISGFTREFIENIVRVPYELIRQPLFYSDEPCDICGKMPHNLLQAQYVHWRCHHRGEFRLYLDELLGWIGGDDLRVELLAIWVGVDLDGFRVWLERAKKIV